MKRFKDLTEREILALAISMEEEHGRIYLTYADGLSDDFPASAKVFEELAMEENEHRRMLLDLFEEKFGTTIPLIRSSDVKGFLKHKPIWLARPLRLEAVSEQAEQIEFETRTFYETALERTSDTS
ncbi:MAG: ferritin family protein, partial [Rhizobiales bacterium]|nr:ferritin family protein [Hyphomicrobiales bacterium]